MANSLNKRISRKATKEEQERHKRIREDIQEELPAITRRAQQKLAEALQRGIALQHTMVVLKAERVKQGLSLADIQARTGMERSTLSRLENQEEANPTVNTLTRYAEAIGKKVFVVLADADTRETEGAL